MMIFLIAARGWGDLSLRPGGTSFGILVQISFGILAQISFGIHPSSLASS